ncbi:unnamed protein product, partial [Bemisia tabaci]
DCLHLQLYRDSRDRYKQGQTKASLSLQYFLGVESGFTLDKESNTFAIICQDVIVVLAFDTRERLIQWQVKVASNLGEDVQFLIQLASAPAKAKISPGPARLHVQDLRFCLTTGVPPRLAGCWNISHLRRYGVVENRFCFEGGSQCGRGEGLYVLLSDQGEQITQTMQAAAENKLSTRRRPVARNMSVMDSPRKMMNSRAGTRTPDFSCSESYTSQRISVLDSNQRINDDGTSFSMSRQSAEDLLGWPSSETRPGSCDYADTASVGEYGPAPNIPECGENTLGRCASCISKLGMMSRSSTATTAFSPAWTMENSVNCRHLSVYSQDSSTSGGSGSGSGSGMEYSVPRTSLRNLATSVPTREHQPHPLSSLPPSMDHCHCCPPVRPPKPAQLSVQANSNQSSPIKKKLRKPPMPLPVTVASTYQPPNISTSSTNVHQCPSCSVVFSNNPYNNYDVPKTLNFCCNSQDTSRMNRIPNSHKNGDLYDMPRSIKSALETSRVFDNYDTPPIPVALNQTSSGSERKILDQSNSSTPSHYCSVENGICVPNNTIQRVKLSGEGKMPVVNQQSGELAIYATVNKAMKTKYAQELNSENSKTEETAVNHETSNNYMNIDAKNNKSCSSEKPSCTSNYQNFEFEQSLEYYENSKQLREKVLGDGTESAQSNSSEKYRTSLNGSNDIGANFCQKCGHACTPNSNFSDQNKMNGKGHEDYLVMEPGGVQNQTLTDNPSRPPQHFLGYLPMSPISNLSCLSKNELLKLKLNNERNHERSASIPSLYGPNFDKCRRRTESDFVRIPGSAMLGINRPASACTSPYLRRHSVDRKRSNSAESTRHPTDLECISERLSSATPTHTASSQNSSIDSLSSQRIVSTVENDKKALSSDSDSSLQTLVRDTVDDSQSQTVHIRRSSSVPCKPGNNRDSSSSNDSGVSTGSLKQRGSDFTDFELPTTTSRSTRQHNIAMSQGLVGHSTCLHASLPRKSKSQDPLGELMFEFQKEKVPAKSSSAEAEIPVCVPKLESSKECVPVYTDSRSTSSGTSDMSDYIETLSLSSHSSSDTPEGFRLGRTTLRPRSGNEYQKIDRFFLSGDLKMDGKQLPPYMNITPLFEKPELSPSSGYSSVQEFH